MTSVTVTENHILETALYKAMILHTVEPRHTTTPLLRLLFCGPNTSPLIFLSENPVYPTTPLLPPTTTFGSPKSLFSLQNYPVNTTSQNAWWGC